MKKICSIVGTRPQYIKMSKIMNLLSNDKEINHIIINTGQHYDYQMSQQFFKELKIPDVNYTLNIKNMSETEQMSEMIKQIGNIFTDEKPDIVIVIGDCNSTLAGAIVASKMKIKLAHIEAGVRSHNLKMSEEINRIITDHCANILFTPTKLGYDTLVKEGISKSRIIHSGDVSLDILNKNIEIARKSKIDTPEQYILMTLHRAENVDKKERLEKILEGLKNFNNIIFSMHPRTKKMIEAFNLTKLIKKMKVIEPVGYFDFLNLMDKCSLFITDSGGAQKEAYFLGKPCVVLRDENEWTEIGKASTLSGCDSAKIKKAVESMFGKPIDQKLEIFGDGKASEKIISYLKHLD